MAGLLALADPQNPRATAAAHLEAGRVEREAGNATAARDHFSQAARAAGIASDDRMMLDALLEEAVSIIDLGRPRDSLGLLDAADALQTRSKLDQSERIALVRGDAYGQAGRAQEAIAEISRVLPQIEARAVRDPSARMLLSTALGQLAAAQRQVDRETARKTLTRALELDEASYGPNHPEVAKTLHDLASAELELELYKEATAHLQRAMKIFVAAYGERHPMVGATYMTFAHLATNQGNLDEGKRMYLQAQGALTGTIPEDSPYFVAIEEGLADIARSQDKCKDAIPHFERALKLMEQTGHSENDHATQLTSLGFCLTDVGRTAEGVKILHQSIDELDRLHMPKRWFSEPYAALADVAWNAGEHAKAIDFEKKAIAALDGEKGTDVQALLSYEQDQLATWTGKKSK
jgi:tetratricopeptide (TPR) repeat protein